MFKISLFIISILTFSLTSHADELPTCYSASCTDTTFKNCRTSTSVPCISTDEINKNQIAPGQQLGGEVGTVITPSQAQLPAATDVEDGVTVGTQTGTLKIPDVSEVLETDTVKDTAGTITNHSSANWNYDQSFPGAGKYTQGVQNIGSIDASKILDDTTVLGVEGTFVEGTTSSVNINTGAEHLTANIHRTKNTAQINHTQIGTLDPTNTGTGYRMRPLIAKDQWGLSSNSNVTVQQRPSGPCGTTGTLNERITNCGNTIWSGVTNGNAGEGDWKLVTVTASGHEVWQDQRTKLLWSDYLGDTNWCQAVGSNDPDDPDDYCNDNSYQPTSAPESWCKEKASPFVTPETYDTAKGNLNLSSSPQVKWKLPTASDYNIAAINGIHLVLPNMSGKNFWSASVRSSLTSNALCFNGSYGFSNHLNRNPRHAVRCIGSAF